MSRWPGRLITKTPVTPAGPGPTASAPGVWTLPEVAYWNKQGRWPSAGADPYWSYVSFLLGTTATNAAQNNTFLDSSTNNFTITRYGNSTQGSFTPYGSLWSNYFDAQGTTTTATNIYTPTSTGLDLQTTGTVECWVYPTARATGASSPLNDASAIWGFYGTDLGSVTKYFGMGITNTGYLYIAVDATSGAASNVSTTLIPLNTWTHIAWVRSGGANKFYVNGADVTSTFSNPSVSGLWPTGATTNRAYIGVFPYLYSIYTYLCPFAGYISNFRAVKGTAVYTGAFTPPAAPLPAISGTGALLCQSNRFYDASGNNLSVTPVGSPVVAPFSPFVLAPPGYDATTSGGSGYFDGNDYITAPANSAFDLGSGDFTLECWVYNSEVSRNVGYAGVWSTSYILYREATVYRFYYFGPGGSPLTSSIPAIANAWTHLAVVRNGSTLTFYVNGAAGATASVGTTAFNNGSTNPFYIASNQDGPTSYGLNGHIAGLRLVKGTALYTAAFTPPTTPVTAVSGTSILCNFTNAGIYDAAMQNNMETVGSAQVSSAQAKYGTTALSSPNSTSYLNGRFNQSMVFGTGDFTIEAWVYSVATSAAYTCITSSRDGIASNANAVFFGLKPTTNQLTFYTSSEIIGTSTAVSTGTWTHVALVRNAGATAIYINGTSVGTATFTTSLTGTGMSVGNEYNGASGSGGIYIDDLRITKGVARYTANFTPPTAALPVY